MLAVHFGAGNIGRGFIGERLYETGYQVCFIDVNAAVIEALNAHQAYDVIIADEAKAVTRVSHVYGINSVTDPQAVLEVLIQADIITISAGATVLPVIAKTLAVGLDRRRDTNLADLNIYVCENMLGGGAVLRKHLLAQASDDLQTYVDCHVAFPSTAVDRIIPLQKNNDPLTVMVEPFFEWVIDSSEVKGNPPNIDGAIYVNNLTSYIERKLFTVNTGHGAIAYLAASQGIETITEAMENSRIVNMLRHVLGETGQLLITKHGFEPQAHQAYIDKIVARFSNPYLSDEVSRVARQPIRKIGKDERFVRPALELLDQGIVPVYLPIIIGMVLGYTNPADDEAVELQATLTTQGLEQTLATYASLSSDSPLVALIQEAYEDMN